MSYILDALRKSDQERAVGVVPDLQSAHQAVRPVQRSYGWIWILVALLAVNGVLMVLLATRDTGTGSTYTTESPVAGPAHVPAGPARPVEEPAVREDRAAASAPEAPKTVLLRDRPTAVAPVIPPVTTTAPVVPAAPVKAQPQVAKAPLQARPAEAPKQGLKDWEDLSLEFRSGLEIPRLDVHVYDADPQRRFVLINLRKYRAGDRLESGAVIEEILPDGLQMSYQGTRFRYQK